MIDAARELDIATRMNNIVGRRARGQSPEEIAADLGLSVVYVCQMIREAAVHQRGAAESLVSEMFMLHHIRLEALYKVVQARIDVMVASNFFDARVIRSAIEILERQSKLLDLDRAKRGTEGAAGNCGTLAWMDKMTNEELVKTAREQYGIVLPPTFNLKA